VRIKSKKVHGLDVAPEFR